VRRVLPFAVALLGLALAGSASAATQLTNGSFESGFGGWSSVNATVEIRTGGAAGVRYAEASRTGGIRFGIRSDQDLRLPAGRRVSAGATVRAKAGVRACVQISELNASGLVGERVGCVVASGQWQPVSTRYSVRSGGRLVVAVIAKFDSGNQHLDIDRVSLRRVRSVYWGAYMDGDDTYAHYYGGRWRDAPWDSRTWRRFESNAGKRVSVVHWGMTPPWQKPFSDYRSTFKLVRQRGTLSAVDMSTGSVPLADIASGTRDAALRDWAQGAASWGRPFFFLLDVEMNGPWVPYAAGVNGNTAADFVAMWRHFHDIAEQAGAANVTWVWCPNIDNRGQFTPYSALYPGDAYVDWTCLDGYNFTGKQSFAWIFGDSYHRLLGLAPGKPVMIGQTASTEKGGRKARWIKEGLARALPRRFPRIKALLWFNWRIHEQGTWRSWPIESSRSSNRAFRRAIRSRGFVPGGHLGRFPLHSPISEP
jgi:hypothetical protein